MLHQCTAWRRVNRRPLSRTRQIDESARRLSRYSISIGATRRCDSQYTSQIVHVAPTASELQTNLQKPKECEVFQGWCNHHCGKTTTIGVASSVNVTAQLFGEASIGRNSKKCYSELPPTH
jgi:hypothetical protein